MKGPDLPALSFCGDVNEFTVINFNNMIPIHPKSLTVIDMKKYPTDINADIDYKNLVL